MTRLSQQHSLFWVSWEKCLLQLPYPWRNVWQRSMGTIPSLGAGGDPMAALKELAASPQPARALSAAGSAPGSTEPKPAPSCAKEGPGASAWGQGSEWHLLNGLGMSWVCRLRFFLKHADRSRCPYKGRIESFGVIAIYSFKKGGEESSF